MHQARRVCAHPHDTCTFYTFTLLSPLTSALHSSSCLPTLAPLCETLHYICVELTEALSPACPWRATSLFVPRGDVCGDSLQHERPCWR